MCNFIIPIAFPLWMEWKWIKTKYETRGKEDGIWICFYFHQIFFSIFHAHRGESSTRNPLRWKSFDDGLVSPRMQRRRRADPEKSYRMVIRTLIKIHSTAKLHVFMALYKVIIEQFYIFLFCIFSSQSLIFFAQQTQTLRHMETSRSRGTTRIWIIACYCDVRVEWAWVCWSELVWMNARDSIAKPHLPTAFSATIIVTTYEWTMNNEWGPT